MAAIAAIAMVATMLLPWYSKTNTFVVNGQTRPGEVSLTAFQAFSFVEAAVLLVAAGVLAMLFRRAEGHNFRLPGGDGTVIMLAGGWAALLVFYRLLDKPGTTATSSLTTTVGVKWGIFLALLAAIGMAYAGARIRANSRPEPPLRRRRTQPTRHGFAEPQPARSDPSATSQAPVPARPRHPPAPPATSAARARQSGSASAKRSEQLSFEDTSDSEQD